MTPPPVTGRACTLAGVVCLVGSGVLLAQDERVTIRFIPAPNQVVHLRSTQDLSLDIAPASQTGPPPVVSLSGTLVAKIASLYTMTLGMPDADGRVEAALVYDELSTEVSLNGVPLPGAETRQGLVGQRLSLTIDRDGRVTDVSTSPENRGLLAASKEMLASVFGTTSPLSLAVGESTTVPLSLALPLPVALNSLNAAGETKYTLQSVDRDGSDRIAHLALATSSHIKQPVQGSGGESMTIDMALATAGTLDANLDRGVVKSSQQHGTLELTLQTTSTNLPFTSLHVRGTVASQTHADY
jgi:hypothetical protein